MISATYAYNVLIAIDQLCNVILAGEPDETLSARAWRQQHNKQRWYFARRVIDALFFLQQDHCLQAYISEQRRHQLPAAYQPNETT